MLSFAINMHDDFKPGNLHLTGELRQENGIIHTNTHRCLDVDSAGEFGRVEQMASVERERARTLEKPKDRDGERHRKIER